MKTSRAGLNDEDLVGGESTSLKRPILAYTAVQGESHHFVRWAARLLSRPTGKFQ